MQPAGREQRDAHLVCGNHGEGAIARKAAVAHTAASEAVDPDEHVVERAALLKHGSFARRQIGLRPGVVEEERRGALKVGRVVRVQLVLPGELARFDHTIVPDDHAIMGAHAFGERAHKVAQVGRVLDTHAILDVEQPAVEAVPARHVAHGRHERVHAARVGEETRAYRFARVELGDERAEDGRVVLVGRVRPRLGRYGDQMVAEVDERVHQAPVIQTEHVTCRRRRR